jgi:hypothetical protein
MWLKISPSSAYSIMITREFTDGRITSLYLKKNIKDDDNDNDNDNVVVIIRMCDVIMSRRSQRATYRITFGCTMQERISLSFVASRISSAEGVSIDFKTYIFCVSTSFTNQALANVPFPSNLENF